MRRIFSSKLTLALKLTPLCLVVIWLLSILNLYARRLGAGTPWPLVAPVLIALVIGYCWDFVRFKRLSVDDQYWYASNYFREVRIPLGDIGEVGERGWNGVTYPIDVFLKSPSGFGSSIRFMPQVRLGRSVGDSAQVIEELRRLAGAS
jgi:hypothetical protein